MNAHDNFVGTGIIRGSITGEEAVAMGDTAGIRQAFAEPDRLADSDDLMTEDLAEDLASEMADNSKADKAAEVQAIAAYDAKVQAERARAEARIRETVGDAQPPYLTANRGLFERQIAEQRAEKAAQQAIAAAALAKARQLTASIRSMEDALDGLLVSEVA